MPSPLLWSICHRFLEACFAGALPTATFRQIIKKASKRRSALGGDGDEEEE